MTPAPNWFFDGALGYAHEDLTIDRAVSYTDAATRSPPPVRRPARRRPTNSARASTAATISRTRISPTGRASAWRGRTGGSTRSASSGSTGLELRFGDEDFESITSTIGAKASMAISTSFGVIVPQAEADWIDEFSNNQQTFTRARAGLEGGPDAPGVSDGQSAPRLCRPGRWRRARTAARRIDIPHFAPSSAIRSPRRRPSQPACASNSSAFCDRASRGPAPPSGSSEVLDGARKFPHPDAQPRSTGIGAKSKD